MAPMTLPWTMAQAAQAVRGTLVGPGGAMPAAVRVDSRWVEPGEAFVALPGARSEGHDFVPQAIQRGASLVVVSERYFSSLFSSCAEAHPGVSWLRVNDTAEALRELAHAWARRVAPSHWIAITGSVGKTTTREVLQGALRRHMGVHAAEKSFNTWIGCAITVLGMPEHTDAVLLEMGANHQGEIGALVESYPPTMAVITEVAAAHLEGFGSLEGVLRAKWEITSSSRLRMLSYNEDNDLLRRAVSSSLSPEIAAVPVGYGVDPFRGVRLESASLAVRSKLPFLRCRCVVYGRPVELYSRLFGTQHAHTLGYALGVSHFLGILPELVARDLEEVPPPRGRGASDLLDGGVLIDESYNSNPASLGVALRNLRTIPLEGRRLAVLGGMRELGASSPQEHRQILREATFLDGLILVGDEWASCREDLPAAGRQVSDAPAALELLQAMRRPGDLIMVKGSRAYALESVVEGLKAS
ncbi:MAG TPA: UDP-N-acetylmuramoyl-tripeptide--D-alanyl-D-alanine ligase [Synergistaceae bacterium]|nr:UDP-N-acetylmuramoyl-tripeptide--D-alanyl-D-alanine ligase [Synergistaceae bacterium]